MFGVLGLIEGFPFRNFLLFAKLRRMVCQARALLAYRFRGIPQELTMRTQEHPLPRVLMRRYGLGPATRGAVDKDDRAGLRKCHGPYSTGAWRRSSVPKRTVVARDN
jgi:hypothetical protein